MNISKKLTDLASVLLISLLLISTSEAIEQDQLIPDYGKSYSPKRDAFEDGRQALKLAKKTGRLVFIEVGGQWCGWCHLLDKVIKADKEVYDALYNNYVVLKVNVSDENSNEAFLSSMPKTNGYPHVFITRDDGTVIHSSDLTHLVKNGKFIKQRILKFFNYFSANKNASVKIKK